MPDLPTRLDLYANGRSYVLQKANKIDPGQIDVEGTDVNLFVGGASVIGDVIVKQLGYSLARMFLDGAFGEDLDRLAWDRYAQLRKGASTALGSVTFSRVAATAGAGTVPIGTSLQSLTGVEYITTTVATFSLSALSATASVRAAQAGHASQVGVNAIQKISQPNLLFDPTIAVNNTLATAGGEDPEDDDTFKNRLRNFWLTARRGVLAAIEQGALSVPGVVSAQAVETLTSTALPARIVNLYIADSSGVASQELANLVSTALLDFRACGIAVLITTSIPVIQSVTLGPLQFQAGVDTVNLKNQIQASVFEFINSLPVNGTLYIAELFGVLQRFKEDGLIPVESNIVSPTGDVVPAVGQTIRTTLDQVVILS